MRRLKLLYARAIEYLYLRLLQQAPPLPGTDPDDGGHMEMRFAWNSSNGRNRPLFSVIISHTRTNQRTRMLMSPRQVQLLGEYIERALADQRTKFQGGHWVGDEAPDWDTRWMRVPDEEK